MSGCSSKQGAQSRFGCQVAASTLNGSGTALALIDDALEEVVQIAHSDGMWSSRSKLEGRQRIVKSMVRGSWWLNPTPNDFDLLLPLILGTAESVDVFAIAEGTLECTLGKDLDGLLRQYNDMHVNRAIFQGRAGGYTTLRLDWVGKEEASLASWLVPAIAHTDDADDPYVFSDSVGALVLGGNAIEMHDFKLTIDNHIVPRFTNSVTPTSFCATDRTITLETTNPFSTANEIALYTATDGVAIASTLTFTNSGVSTIFSLPKITNERRTPKARGKVEIPQRLRYTARATGKTATTYELKVTNDAAA